MKALLKQLMRRVWRRTPSPVLPQPSRLNDADFLVKKQHKLERIRSLLNVELPYHTEPLYYDFLTNELRAQFSISDTDNVSAHNYDYDARVMIGTYADGLILDCGAGYRPVYYENVVNFEICPYESTDVRGVAERLPFQDNVFDAVFSFAVLEHVRDPFACAREMLRVLKPGGKLYCVVPFLQPFHAYPHHYYNMTAQGLANLFADEIIIEKQEINTGGMPIFMLTWVLQRWAAGLPEAARSEFLNMRVADLIADPNSYIDQAFVTQLPKESQFELAATTSLFARKPKH